MSREQPIPSGGRPLSRTCEGRQGTGLLSIPVHIPICWVLQRICHRHVPSDTRFSYFPLISHQHFENKCRQSLDTWDWLVAQRTGASGRRPARRCWPPTWARLPSRLSSRRHRCRPSPTRQVASGRPQQVVLHDHGPGVQLLAQSWECVWYSWLGLGRGLALTRLEAEYAVTDSESGAFRKKQHAARAQSCLWRIPYTGSLFPCHH